MEIVDWFTQISEFATDGVFLIKDGNLEYETPKIISCNDAACLQSGFEKQELIGRPATVFLGAGRSDESKVVIDDQHWRRLPTRHQLRNLRKNGQLYHVNLALYAVPGCTDSERYWLGIQNDLSRLETLKEKLALARSEAGLFQKRLWDAIEALPDAFVMYDKHDRLVACNSKYKEFYAASAAAIYPDASFEDIMRFGVENGQYPEAIGNEAEWLEAWRGRHRQPTKPVERELSGERFIVLHDVVTDSGDLVGLRTDVTELRRQRKRLEVQASALKQAKTDAEIAARTDPLTSVGNRRGLDLFLQNLSSSDSDRSEIGLIQVDLDRFKAINDIFGHSAGDFLLQHVASILASHARPDDYVARVGGDEFVVAVHSDHAEEASKSLAKRVITACKEPIEFGDSELRFGASIGIAVADSVNLSGLMERADLALYDAKESGRGRYACYAPELLLSLREKKFLCDEFEKGFCDEQLVPHFQPQLSAFDYSLVGVEALARWEHPTMGTMLPGSFLPIAEELGILADLDEYILEKSVAAVRRLKDQGNHVPKLSINVGYSRFLSKTLLLRLKELKPWPCQIALELLETIDFDEDNDDLEWIIAECKSMNIGVELDDFGSGRASLTNLIKLQPDRIKLDSNITATIGSNVDGSRHMLKAICEMSKALGIGVTAEGVETDEQAKVLTQFGCDILQGHLFSTALTEHSLGKWMSNGAINEPILNCLQIAEELKARRH